MPEWSKFCARRTSHFSKSVPNYVHLCRHCLRISRRSWKPWKNERENPTLFEPLKFDISTVLTPVFKYFPKFLKIVKNLWLVNLLIFSKFLNTEIPVLEPLKIRSKQFDHPSHNFLIFYSLDLITHLLLICKRTFSYRPLQSSNSEISVFKLLKLRN